MLGGNSSRIEPVLAVYADGHTKKFDGLVSVGYVVYNLETDERVCSDGYVYRTNVNGSMEGEYLAVLVATLELAKVYHWGKPAVVANDNNFVIKQLRLNGQGHRFSLRLKNLCRVIIDLAAKVPVVEFSYTTCVKDSHMGEAHKIASDWGKDIMPISLENILT